jgi:hypothetical protein
MFSSFPLGSLFGLGGGSSSFVSSSQQLGSGYSLPFRLFYQISTIPVV